MSVHGIFHGRGVEDGRSSALDSARAAPGRRKHGEILGQVQIEVVGESLEAGLEKD